MSWVAAIDYRQGSAHRRAGIPCQDYGRLVQPDENTVIAALSDGAGTAPMSRDGARVAVNTALPWLQDRLGQVSDRGRPMAPPPLEDLFDGLIRAVRSRLQEAANLSRRPLSDFACTLSLMILRPSGLAAAQIGDGSIVARRRDRADSSLNAYELIIPPRQGEYVNETPFVTDADSESQLVRRRLESPVHFVGASTDGLNSVSIDLQEARPHAPFFAPIDRFAKDSRSSTSVHSGLREFLGSKRLSEAVQDDVTLFVCRWQDGAAMRA